MVHVAMNGPAHGPGPALPHEQVCVLVLASPSLRESWRDGLSNTTCVVPSTIVPHSMAGTMDPGGFQRHGPTLQVGLPMHLSLMGLEERDVPDMARCLLLGGARPAWAWGHPFGSQTSKSTGRCLPSPVS